MKKQVKQPKYFLNDKGEFVIENYLLSRPFANFFPGIAGKYGIPMWSFYVNRGQGICSFGTKDKDHSILEFFPANKAWQFVSSYGFRTFIKINNSVFYEPFQNTQRNQNFNISNRMLISSGSLAIEEENRSLGLSIRVEYFNIPNDSFAGLARVVSIKNLSRKPQKLQVLDGLPQIVPYGTNNYFLKKMGRTIEAWMNVENLKKNAPFYKLAVDPSDRPEVVHITEGNFYLGFSQENNKTKLSSPIVNPQLIFGQVSDFSYPAQFFSKDETLKTKNATFTSKTPCAFTQFEIKLASEKEKTFYSLTGYMRNKETLNRALSRIACPSYLKQKKEENEKLISGLQSGIETRSASKNFDLYAKQTYLDNIMRGGYPLTFNGNSVFYLYSRKHGDLERDYNRFYLAATYFSQGNGNYRDVNQNRRLDAWFNPEVKDRNIISFFNLIQSDGFNPLVVKGASFTLADASGFKTLCAKLIEGNGCEKIMRFLEKPFTPGEVVHFIEDNHIRLKTGYDEFIQNLIASSSDSHEAEHGEGFWTDHWAYNLDLLENYLNLYPENFSEIFFQKREFTYFDNSETVRPRSEKYALYHGQPRQLHAVMPDNTKREMIKKRNEHPHLARAKYGKGEIYETTLFNKLLCLAANKLASLDPFGVGIEMEANKPNWYDALNGLPALFGSSSAETFELKRLALLIKEALEKHAPQKLYVTEEVREFLLGLGALLKETLNAGSSESDFQYWDKSYALKEEYRQKTKFGFSGDEVEMDKQELLELTSAALEKLNSGIKKALDKKQNIYYTYFINEVAEYETLGEHSIRPKRFIQKKLPLFLEGQMHALRLCDDAGEAKKLHLATKKSALFDKKLKMYKVTAPLSSCPFEIGRCRAFTPGWLENESVWLHMEYKYLLEMLKQGLYEDFYAEFKNVLVPFQKPESYGRSILENSSFIVSSAFPDKNMRGSGFVARLSGSTAEFLNIWLLMNIGKVPFSAGDNGLNLRFQPALAGWLFDKKGNYSFNFLSSVRVHYHNPERKNTFGAQSARVKKIAFRDKDGKLQELPSDTIPAPYAAEIRARQIKQIDIYLK